jgi:RNA polymerase sigma factor (sigma-70 family)
MTENGTERPVARRRPQKQSYCHEAQMQLVRQAQAGDSAAMGTLIEENQGLIWREVHRTAPHAHHLSHDDLFQEGACGFLKAVERFDTSSGNRLSTYATWWIRQAVTRAMQCQDDLIRLPARVYEQMQRGKRTRQPHEQAALSLDAPYGEGDFTLGDLLAAPEQVQVTDPRLADVLAALAALPELQRRAVLALAHGQARAQQAAEEGISSSAIAKREQAALAALRAACCE